MLLDTGDYRGVDGGVLCCPPPCGWAPTSVILGLSPITPAGEAKSDTFDFRERLLDGKGRRKRPLLWLSAESRVSLPPSLFCSLPARDDVRGRVLRR